MQGGLLGEIIVIHILNMITLSKLNKWNFEHNSGKSFYYLEGTLLLFPFFYFHLCYYKLRNAITLFKNIHTCVDVLWNMFGNKKATDTKKIYNNL